jgi:hypothetical protein
MRMCGRCGEAAGGVGVVRDECARLGAQAGSAEVFRGAGSEPVKALCEPGGGEAGGDISPEKVGNGPCRSATRRTS